jgi:hypothetical protein
MKEIKFYRGLKSNYSADLHKDGVYFATDEREIILNGQSYGTEVDDTLLSNSINPVVTLPNGTSALYGDKTLLRQIILKIKFQKLLV